MLSVGALGTELTQLTHDYLDGGTEEVGHCDWVSLVDQGDVSATEILLGVLAVGGRL